MPSDEAAAIQGSSVINVQDAGHLFPFGKYLWPELFLWNVTKGSSTDILLSVYVSAFLFCSIKTCLELYNPLLTFPSGLSDFVDLYRKCELSYSCSSKDHPLPQWFTPEGGITVPTMMNVLKSFLRIFPWSKAPHAYRAYFISQFAFYSQMMSTSLNSQVPWILKNV